MDNRILVAAAQWGASQAQQTTEKGTACSTSNFRKKPVVIQAKQLTEETIREVYEWVHGPVTLKHRLAEDRWDDYCGIVTTDGMNIPTLEDGSDGRAKHVASIGDWIIRGIAGEFYPCKPDIFAATYEPVAQAQQTTEPELPEPEAIRHSFDGYGWMYIDNGHGSGWRSGIDKADAEFMYTAAQMHDHYAAGVRAGAAGSQWQPIDSAPKDGKCLVLVDTDDGVLKSAEVERTNALLRHAYAVIEEAVELIGSDECTAKETLAAIKQHLGGV